MRGKKSEENNRFSKKIMRNPILFGQLYNVVNLFSLTIKHNFTTDGELVKENNQA